MSDPSGAFEVTLFADTLEAAQDQLQSGAQVVVTVEATMEADQLKLLARSVAPIDTVVADVGGMGLKVFIEEARAVEAVQAVLDDARKVAALKAGRGPVQLCVMAGDLGEVELDLGEDFPVNPAIKGAIKSLGGVLDVQDI
jgi:DNA polymerase-3 subunit alpha